MHATHRAVWKKTAGILVLTFASAVCGKGHERQFTLFAGALIGKTARESKENIARCVLTHVSEGGLACGSS
jgi:hypothetical protein